jgi:hypothetical protein
MFQFYDAPHTYSLAKHSAPEQAGADDDGLDRLHPLAR